LRPAQQDAIGLRQKIGCLTLLSPSAQKVVLNFLFFKAFVYFSRQFYCTNSRTLPIPFGVKTARRPLTAAIPLRREKPTDSTLEFEIGRSAATKG
jgi:hypothetical protein